MRRVSGSPEMKPRAEQTPFFQTQLHGQQLEFARLLIQLIFRSHYCIFPRDSKSKLLRLAPLFVFPLTQCWDVWFAVGGVLFLFLTSYKYVLHLAKRQLGTKRRTAKWCFRSQERSLFKANCTSSLFTGEMLVLGFAWLASVHGKLLRCSFMVWIFLRRDLGLWSNQQGKVYLF